jgi:hypothetical protein
MGVKQDSCQGSGIAGGRDSQPTNLLRNVSNGSADPPRALRATRRPRHIRSRRAYLGEHRIDLQAGDTLEVPEIPGYQLEVLDDLGLSPEPQQKPPPVRELLRVAERGEGWGAPAEWD